MHPYINDVGKSGVRAVVAALPLLSGAALADDIYVSTTGTAGAPGTITEPVDLNTALNQPLLVGPGDTVWLTEGTYVGPFTKLSTPAGTATEPIIYRAMPGARVTLTAADDDLYALTLSNVAHIWIWGIEATMGGREELGYIPSAAVYIQGGGRNKVINCVIHDTPNRSGLGAFATLGGEFYGNIIYRNGLYANQLGHGIYSQNRPDIAGGNLNALPWMEHRENIIFDNFGTGQHSYGSAPQLAKMRYEGTVSYGNGLPEGSTLPVLNYIVGGMQYDDLFELRECFSWFPAVGSFKRGVDLGYIGGLNGRLTVEDCVWIGGLEALWLRGWEQVTASGNTLYTHSGHAVVLERPFGFDPAPSDVDANTYYDLPATFTFRTGSAQYDDLPSWTAETTFDGNSTLLNGPPSGQWVFLRPNAYDPDRAHLIIYNWPLAPTASIDFGVQWDLAPDDAFRILPVLDVWGTPTAAGIYRGQPVDITIEGTYAPEFTTYLVIADRCEADPGDTVDITDFLQLLAAWGPCAGCPEDTNCDGVVDLLDLLTLLANWSF